MSQIGVLTNKFFLFYDFLDNLYFYFVNDSTVFKSEDSRTVDKQYFDKGSNEK